jgi:hypothetical protein
MEQYIGLDGSMIRDGNFDPAGRQEVFRSLRRAECSTACSTVRSPSSFDPRRLNQGSDRQQRATRSRGSRVEVIEFLSYGAAVEWY